MISATVTGNVGRDGQLGDAGGTPVLNFSLASRRWDKGEEHTDWVAVAFFGERARKVAQYVTKGSRVAVRGSMYGREYTHNGEKRSELTLRADDVELLGGGQEKATNKAPAGRDADIPF